MFAVIKTGGKQYVVKEGDILSIEKLDVEPGQRLLFGVLLVEADDRTLIGTPLVDTAAVVAEVLKTYKDEKVLVFKKKRRKQYRRTRGHRQLLTEVKIEKIYPDTTSLPAESLKFETVKKGAPAAEAPAPAPVKAKRAAKPPKPKVEPEEPPVKVKKGGKPKAKAAAKSAPAGKPKAGAKKAGTPR
jgi:large subunit ribosomal protein L21